MVHKDPSNIDSKPEIKQVEFNTIASSFGGLSAKVSALHKYALTQLLPSAILMVMIGTSFPSPPTHQAIHPSSPTPLSLLTHLLRPYPVESPLLIKHMATLRTRLNYLSAPCSSFKILKTMYLTNTLWLPIFSQTTTSSPSAFLYLLCSPIPLSHPTHHLDL